MELNEIKEYIEANRDNPEVAKYIDSLADRRVNLALEKAKAKHEADIEERVKARFTEQEEKTALLRARENKLGEAFGGNLSSILSIGAEMMGDLGQFADEAAFESKLASVRQRLVETFGSQPRPKGGDCLIHDGDLAEFRDAMGLKT